MCDACFPAKCQPPVRPIVRVLIAWLCPISSPLNLSSALDCGDSDLAICAESSRIVSHHRRCATISAGGTHKKVSANSDGRSLILSPSRIHTSGTFSKLLVSPLLLLRGVSWSGQELALTLALTLLLIVRRSGPETNLACRSESMC